MYAEASFLLSLSVIKPIGQFFSVQKWKTKGIFSEELARNWEILHYFDKNVQTIEE